LSVLEHDRSCFCTLLRCCSCTPICYSAPAPLLRCCSLRSNRSIWELVGAAWYLDFCPAQAQAGEKDERHFEKRNLSAACLGCVSMWRCSGLMPRAALCLEGHWVKMRPGKTVMAHPHRRMAVGCHLQQTQRGTSYCAVTRTSSAVLRGGECFSSSHFSTNPSPINKSDKKG